MSGVRQNKNQKQFRRNNFDGYTCIHVRARGCRPHADRLRYSIADEHTFNHSDKVAAEVRK